MPISAAWSITKDIASLGRKIFDNKVSDEVRKEVQDMVDKSTELYDRIIFLEEERQSNRQLISELQDKIKRSKNFNREFKKYVPYKFESGAFVYTYDVSVHEDKPSHYICTKCVEDSVISILQPKDKEGYQFCCHVCNSVYVVKNHCMVGMLI